MPKRRSEAVENAAKYYEEVMRQKKAALEAHKRLQSSADIAAGPGHSSSKSSKTSTKVETAVTAAPEVKRQSLPRIPERRAKTSARKSTGTTIAASSKSLGGGYESNASSTGKSKPPTRRSSSSGNEASSPRLPRQIPVAMSDEDSNKINTATVDKLFDETDDDDEISAPPTKKRRRTLNPPTSEDVMPARTSLASSPMTSLASSPMTSLASSPMTNLASSPMTNLASSPRSSLASSTRTSVTSNDNALSCPAGPAVKSINPNTKPTQSPAATNPSLPLEAPLDPLSKQQNPLPTMTQQQRTPPRNTVSERPSLPRDLSGFGALNASEEGFTTGVKATNTFQKPPFGSPLPGMGASLRRQRAASASTATKPALIVNRAPLAPIVPPPVTMRTNSAQAQPTHNQNLQRYDQSQDHMLTALQGVTDISNAIRMSPVDNGVTRQPLTNSPSVLSNNDFHTLSEEGEEDIDSCHSNEEAEDELQDKFKNKLVDSFFDETDISLSEKPEDTSVFHTIFTLKTRLFLFAVLFVTIAIAVLVATSFIAFKAISLFPRLLNGNVTLGFQNNELSPQLPPCFADSLIPPDPRTISRIKQMDALTATFLDDSSIGTTLDHTLSVPQQCLRDDDHHFVEAKACPVGGRCYGGLLLECASSNNNHFSMSSDSQTCMLTDSALTHIKLLKDQLHQWNAIYKCTLLKNKRPSIKHLVEDKIPIPFMFNDTADDADENSSRLFFDFKSLTHHLEVSSDLEVILAANQNESVFLLKTSQADFINDIWIGLHPKISIDVPFSCYLQGWIRDVMTAFATALWMLLLLVTTSIVKLFLDAPIVTSIVTLAGTSVLVLVHYVHTKRNAKKIFEEDVINLRQKVCLELSSQPGVAIPSHLICERISWRDYPASRAKREYISKTLWPFVVQDIRTDTRIAKLKKRMVNDDSVVCDHWQWIDVVIPSGNNSTLSPNKHKQATLSSTFQGIY